MRRALFFLPLAVLGIIIGLSLWSFTSGRDPNALPSALVGGPVPAFDLPAPPGVGGAGLASRDLAEGVHLVNVFASWCAPCRAEHATITELAAEVPVHGLAYKDAVRSPEDTARFLEELGNPYARVGMDDTGRTGIDWGISGVPETFVVADGVVTFRAAGPLVGEGGLTAQLRAALAEAGAMTGAGG